MRMYWHCSQWHLNLSFKDRSSAICSPQTRQTSWTDGVAWTTILLSNAAWVNVTSSLLYPLHRWYVCGLERSRYRRRDWREPEWDWRARRRWYCWEISRMLPARPYAAFQTSSRRGLTVGAVGCCAVDIEGWSDSFCFSFTSVPKCVLVTSVWKAWRWIWLSSLPLRSRLSAGSNLNIVKQNIVRQLP